MFCNTWVRPKPGEATPIFGYDREVLQRRLPFFRFSIELSLYSMPQLDLNDLCFLQQIVCFYHIYFQIYLDLKLV